MRNADGSLNTKLLESQGITSAQFAERMRQQISLSQVTGGVEGTASASTTSNKIAVDSLFQVRDVQWMKFEARAYASALSPTPEQLKKFFDEPKQAAAFLLPERADVQYVVLDLDSLKSRVAVSEEELRKYYQENLKLYIRDEERRASHILIKADKGAAADVRKAARAKAEALLAQVRKTPAVFAELARNNGVAITLKILSQESLIPRGRNTLVAEFLGRSELTHLLFIDADIGFDPMGILRMLAFDKPLIGGAYAKKGIDWQRVRAAALAGQSAEHLAQAGLDYALNLVDEDLGDLIAHLFG